MLGRQKKERLMNRIKVMPPERFGKEVDSICVMLLCSVQMELNPETWLNMADFKIRVGFKPHYMLFTPMCPSASYLNPELQFLHL